MKAIPDNISKIISKFLVGVLNKEERAVLSKWLENPDNEKQFYEIVDVEVFLERLKYYQDSNFDSEKAYKKVVRRYSLYREWIPYAAAVLIPLAVAFWTQSDNWQETPKTIELASKTEIQSQPQMPILITDDGEYALGESDTTFVIGGTELVSNHDLLSYNKGNKANETKEGKLIYNTIRTPKGVKYNVVLSDGTEVWLNSETEFRYPVNFSGENREVFVKGEAYFDVTKDKNMPFLVSFEDRQVRVLGTKFNVKSYNNEKHDLVTLVEGSIILADKNDEIKLVPDQQAVIDNTGKTFKIRNVDGDLYTAWKDNVYLYRNETLQTIVNDIERDFDIKVSYQDQEMRNEEFSLKISREISFEDIFSAIEKTNEVDIEIENNNVIIRKAMRL
ncbi:MAG: FecR family protein [Mangrovibacterium sp.]